MSKGEIIDKEYGLHICNTGTIITLHGNIYHKICFLTCPLKTTKKKWVSGLGSWDNIIFQVSLTDNQILAFKKEVDRLVESLIGANRQTEGKKK